MFWNKKTKNINQEKSKKRYAFRINQRMRLIVKKSGVVHEFQSVVQDVLEDRIRILSLKDRYLSLINDENTSIEAEIYEDNGVYRFATKYLGTVCDVIDMYELSKPVRIHRLQRRKYKRIGIDWQINYEIDSRQQAKYPHLKARGLFKAQDISATGMRLVSTQALPIGLNLKLEFAIGIKLAKKIVVSAEVIDSFSDVLAYKFVTRLKFVDIKDYLRIIIDDYICSQG